jgi:hypothetical protein
VALPRPGPEAGTQAPPAPRDRPRRKHVEKDLGYDIVANFGDQFSDLVGGHADRQVKLPNPTYYLP